jgi:hypothetical protein
MLTNRYITLIEVFSKLVMKLPFDFRKIFG